MNAYIKFGENLSICSQDIEQKKNWCKSRAITLVHTEPIVMSVPQKSLSIEPTKPTR